MKIVLYPDLKDYGIDYTATHINRLVKAGKFPKPSKMNGLNAWSDGQIGEHVASIFGKQKSAA